MKVNMPVTDHEVHFSEDQTLVSKTDLKGIITYVNKEFIRISGFTEEELIGKNHNLVRHPDMPPEAFQDLWDTLKEGKPWIQMVKNRCKNGDYYWVKANVTPVYENGQLVEYMSVRAKPTREEIAAAEIAFQQLKNGKIKLENGNARKPGISTLTSKYHNIKISHQFAAIGFLFAFLTGIIVWQLSILQDNVEFSAKELYGVEYVAPVRKLLELIPQHRGMSNAYLNGDTSFEAKIRERQADIDDAFNTAFDVDAKFGAELNTSSMLQAIKQDWNSIKNSVFDMNAKDSFRRHTDLIANVQGLIIHTGDTSNLILDPDLDSFYNMDLVINKIPALVEYMGQARGFGSGVIAHGKDLNPAQKQRLIELSVALNIAMNGVDQSYKNGASASTEVKQRLGTQAKAAEDAVHQFVKSVEQIRDQQYQSNAQVLFAEGTRAIGESFKLYDASHALLNELLERRVSNLQLTFYIIVLLTTLSILFVAISGFAVSQNILKALKASLDNFATIANGDFSKGLTAQGNNELSALARSINSVRIKMGFEVEDSAIRAAESSRIKQALDVAQTNVMMADTDYNIIYMNDAIQRMFNDVETDLQTDLPNFDSKHLLGQNIDVFHKNPSHQRQMMDKLVEPYQAQIVIGGRTFKLVATPVISENNERLGTVVEWLDRTEELARTNEERRIANENLRIKQALDNVSANVMVADPDRTIIYMNESVVNTLRNAQDDLRKDLPNFDVDKLLGNSIDSFHKNPEHQARLLSTLTETYDASVIIGGRHMDLSVNPIISENDERLGSVVEWKDRTLEVAVEREVDEIVEAAAGGNLSKRIELEGKTGFFKKLSEGLNELLDSASSFVKDIDTLFANMSEGDLSQPITNNYDGDFERIKVNANNTAHKLTDILTKVRESANTVHTASNEIAQGNADLSQRTEEQASSLEETASSMEEITATVKQSSDNASEANLLANEARDKAQRGGSVVQGAISAMSEILESSNRINDIIGVIDEIAFQTNLLALNAAVEAARAGEQGRGFAVVAGEVRNLSQRSAAAAREIKDLIRDSVTKVETGSTLVNDSGETLTAIVHAVEKVAHMIKEVNNAAAEQTSGIEQINQAVAQMDEMTQQNAALVEEAAAASEAMSEQASNMNRLISFFKLGDSVSHAPMMPSPPPAPVKAPIETYKPQAKDSGPAASFSGDDEWEDF